MEEDFEISEEELKEAKAVVSSLEFYVSRSLPHAEEGLIEIAQKLREGEIPIERHLIKAIIHRTVGINALSKYATESTVKEYMERIQRLYEEVASYFPGSPE